MRGRAVTSALVALALGVGVVVGLAAPRSSPDAGEDTSPSASGVTQADLDAKQALITDLAVAAASQRVDGMRVAILVTPGTPAEDVTLVEDALALGGATVATTATMSADWWEPALSSFRAELAAQVSGTVVGVEGLGATDVIQHAIVQALVPGAVPRGTTVDGTEADAIAAGQQRQEVLLEVLKRAELMAADGTASDGVDALVIITAEGPEGAGAVLASAARVWETYVGISEIVVSGASADGSIAGDADAAAAEGPAPTRPSVVRLDRLSDSSEVMWAQVVLALVEQAQGGAGTYGLGDEAVPDPAD